MVKGDVGRVADFFVPRRTVRVLLCTGGHMFVAVLHQAGQGGSLFRIIIDRTGQIGIGPESGVDIVEIHVDQVID